MFIFDLTLMTGLLRTLAADQMAATATYLVYIVGPFVLAVLCWKGLLKAPYRALGAGLLAAFGLALAAWEPLSVTRTSSQRENSTVAGPDYSAVVSKYRFKIPEMMKREGIPGLSIAVVDDETVIWSEGFGFKDRENGGMMTPETLFSLQSASKAVTASAILIAVQDGLLDLDAPIKTYLPNFTINSRFERHPEERITLRHLLSHTAGLTHEAPVGNNFDPRSASFEQHVQSISDTWLRYPVGQRYSYSNLGMDLAGYILQVRSGLPFAEYVRQKLFAPFGMKNSSFNMGTIRKCKNRAVGHDANFSKVPLEIPMVPSGGLYSSASEMARFIQFHLNMGRVGGKSLLRERLIKEMYTIPFPVKGQLEGYALGVDVGRKHGTVYLNHGGGGFGFLSDLLWYPEFGVGIVVLTNSVNHSLQHRLAHEIIDEIIERKNPHGGAFADKASATDSCMGSSTKLFERFLGRYVGRSSDIEVRLESNGVGLRDDRGFHRLYFSSEVEACSVEGSEIVPYRFLLGNGLTRSLLRILDGVSWDYNDGPNDVPGPDKPEWKKYLGEYSYRIWGKRMGAFKVSRKYGYLYLDHFRLEEFKPGLFLASNGEVLDLRVRTPTWRNIKLAKP